MVSINQSLEPNLLVVFGSESPVIKPLIEEFAKKRNVIRIYNRSKPEPKQNCIDLKLLDQLAEVIQSLELGEGKRIAFVGVATLSQQKLFTQLKNDEVDLMIDTNIRKYISVLSELLPIMIREKYGRLVYLSSFRTKFPARGASIYTASKLFCESLFSSIGQEYGRLNITSTSIRMGFFSGRMIDDLPSDLIEGQLKKVSLRRHGTGLELMQTINLAFANPYLNGGLIDLNGGYSSE